jgi:hypothetical protein
MSLRFWALKAIDRPVAEVLQVYAHEQVSNHNRCRVPEWIHQQVS